MSSWRVLMMSFPVVFVASSICAFAARALVRVRPVIVTEEAPRLM